jgi:hypothetical protein
MANLGAFSVLCSWSTVLGYFLESRYTLAITQSVGSVEWRSTPFYCCVLAHKQSVKHHNSTPTCSQKHIRKKPILVAYTLKQECGGGSLGHSSTASEAEPPSVPPLSISPLINIGPGIYPTQPYNQPKPLRRIERCHRVSIRLPCLGVDGGRGRRAEKRNRAPAVTQWQRRSHGDWGKKDFIFILCPSHNCKGKIIFIVGIGQDITGASPPLLLFCRIMDLGSLSCTFFH